MAILNIPSIVLYTGIGLIGLFLGYIIRQRIAQRYSDSIEAKLKTRIEKVRNEARDVVLEAREKATKILEESEEEKKKRKVQLDKTEERLFQREESIDKKQAETAEEEKENKRIFEKVENLKTELEKLQKSELASLEKVAGLSINEAKKNYLERTEKEYKEEIIQFTQKIRNSKERRNREKSKEIICRSNSKIQSFECKWNYYYNNEFTLGRLKRKIIGREGRNIRHFEKLSGVELIMDDSPNTIILSSFDPARREVARIALDKLIQDGRIQPAKIEEKIIEAQAELREAPKKQVKMLRMMLVY